MMLAEALHISKRERQIVLECFRKIREELQANIDKHTANLTVSNIELLFNYCLRFYDRQFITRAHVNKDVLTRFEDYSTPTTNLNYRKPKAYLQSHIVPMN